MSKHITPNPWRYLKKYTPARIALGNTGGSLPTSELLQFQMDHALAKDAVHSVANFNHMEHEIKKDLGVNITQVRSCAHSREEYLKRPDLGRKLHDKSKEDILKNKEASYISIIIGDGLSATAINLHAVSLLRELYPQLKKQKISTQIVLAKEARVALGDEIGEINQSTISIMVIGERPGLSNAKSMGAYITYSPKIERADSKRNCISNICPDGLPIKKAAAQIMRLISLASKYQVTGVELSKKMNSCLQENTPNLSIN